MPEHLLVEGYGWAIIPSTGIAVAGGRWRDRQLEGRRLGVDETFKWDESAGEWKVVAGYYHFAFKDSYDYNKRLWACQNPTNPNIPTDIPEYFEFSVDNYTYKVWTKGSFDTIELNLEVMTRLYTRYNWLEIKKEDTTVSRGYYWFEFIEDFIGTDAYKITLKDASYDGTNWTATFKVEKGTLDTETLTATYTEVWGDNITLYPAIQGYDRDTESIPDLTLDVNLEDVYSECIVVDTNGNVIQSPSSPKCWVRETKATEEAYYFILLFERKWTVNSAPLYAVKIKNGLAVWNSDLNCYVTSPQAISDLCRVVLYAASFKILGTNIPEVLDRLYVDIKEVIVETDTEIPYGVVY